MAEKSRWAPGAAALADAARVISSVAFDGRSFMGAKFPAGFGADRAQPVQNATQRRDFEWREESAGFGAGRSERHRAAVMAIALGSIRWYLRLTPAIERLLSRPQGVEKEIRALLTAAAHQIEYSRNAPEAVAHAAVDATRILRQGRASGLVNAVLRRFVAERASLFAEVDRSLPGRTAHPVWLVKLLERAWPGLQEGILTANNEHPPLVLRVDLSRTSRSSYLDELARADIMGSPVGWAPAAVRLDRPLSVPLLPRFSEGVVSVQDAGAQLAAQLLDAQPGMRVLDACAAPGGKTGHLLEHTPDLELWAIDVDAQRVTRISENLERLGRTARVLAADVCEPSTFWDGRPFDRILVDAPCSSTGVIRRHPDIKLLRRPTDIAAFAGLQQKILACAFGMLKSGGRLLYCTCSVLPEENEKVVERLLDSQPTARVAAMPPAQSLVPGAADAKHGIQLIPGSQAGTDGFYYACLEKTTAGT